MFARCWYWLHYRDICLLNLNQLQVQNNLLTHVSGCPLGSLWSGPQWQSEGPPVSPPGWPNRAGASFWGSVCVLEGQTQSERKWQVWLLQNLIWMHTFFLWSHRSTEAIQCWRIHWMGLNRKTKTAEQVVSTLMERANRIWARACSNINNTVHRQK